MWRVQLVLFLCISAAYLLGFLTGRRFKKKELASLIEDTQSIQDEMEGVLVKLRKMKDAGELGDFLENLERLELLEKQTH